MANLPEPDATESLVAESGSYELLKNRLADRGARLLQKTQALNEARLAEFGRAKQKLISEISELPELSWAKVSALYLHGCNTRNGANNAVDAFKNIIWAVHFHGLCIICLYVDLYQREKFFFHFELSAGLVPTGACDSFLVLQHYHESDKPYWRRIS